MEGAPAEEPVSAQAPRRTIPSLRSGEEASGGEGQREGSSQGGVQGTDLGRRAFYGICGFSST